ncbi:Chloroplast processing peptidase [Triticum urartu]|uniref:signal peptidase I n=1 Tax=Triticum urartu TaxID=4572 RepID=M8AI00_TRIUA|nr:Chloroplast processing peptidase [Triticum urartu]
MALSDVKASNKWFEFQWAGSIIALLTSQPHVGSRQRILRVRPDDSIYYPSIHRRAERSFPSLTRRAPTTVTYMFRKPSAGDVVFFRVPAALQNCGINKDVVFIKRVVATPGDFIEVRQGQLIVNGVAQNEHYTAPHGGSDTMEAMRLPEDHVFVMGDNRNNSCDSRAWGPLPISNIVGRHIMSFTRSSLQ